MERKISSLNDSTLLSADYTVKEERHSERQPDIDLVQMLLKRQAELNSLLEITLAINKNSDSSVLYEMLEVVLRTNLNVGSMMMMVKQDKRFACVSRFGVPVESLAETQSMCATLAPLKTISSLNDFTDPSLQRFNYFVPVRHKNSTLAFVLIGDFNAVPELLSHELNFIQTLINVVVVGLENKKLFRERVHRERLQRDIELAGEVQNMLVPLTLPESEFFDISATYLPHQSIGGDYFDFIRLDEDEFIWCIADVSGKGISAALLMANLQASLRAWTSVERDLATIIRKLNEVVTKNTNGERFITLFLGRYNIRTRNMEYVNAGHNAPLLVVDGTVSSLKSGTTLLGVFDQLPFVNIGKQKISENTLIFNYTDGLIESFEEDIFITEEELSSILLRNGQERPEIINRGVLIDIQLSKMAKMNSDDITLLTLKIH
ncbi:sigma-B regulation protein RsbU (phosphoserine phosphatase) [Arcticibacter pallidicorallinus]|uniref:Sigma-B regulation protein RsbU (Phosphoserine phosphatase) n=1 Tax=Arcticibacter pallidicorallinus TaxID=1259464 RepID=A0A2T0U6S9_9SPHI|nr:SpoIIE family protein phosphatase [Arcticibacter pallidicorallinus]PRY53619.1 sigma-B regulation protein RsbU (phosphoserine phosphatase) [Arcticibacter pallidicorallinus]